MPISMICPHVQNQDYLEDVGGIDTIVACMDAHSGHAVLEEQAVLALCNIGFHKRHLQVT